MLYLALVPVLVAGLGAIANYYPPFNEGPLPFVYFLLTNLGSPIGAYVPVIWFLVHTLKAPQGPRRMQYAGAAAALMIWTMNDGLEPLRAVQRMGLGTFEMDAYVQIYAVASILGMILTVALVVLISAEVVRGRRGRAAAITVGTWTLIGVALSQLQHVPDSLAGRLTIHLVVDMATYLILFYFVARYQVLDVALSRPSFTTRGLAAAIGLTAVIATQVMLEEVMGSAFGWFGAIIAGATVAATIPLQQRFERARARSPMAVGQYEAFRRMQVYHAAVEGAFQDGQLDGGDNLTLANLRRALDVTFEDHEQLLADLSLRS